MHTLIVNLSSLLLLHACVENDQERSENISFWGACGETESVPFILTLRALFVKKSKIQPTRFNPNLNKKFNLKSFCIRMWGWMILNGLGSFCEWHHTAVPEIILEVDISCCSSSLFLRDWIFARTIRTSGVWFSHHSQNTPCLPLLYLLFTCGLSWDFFLSLLLKISGTCSVMSDMLLGLTQFCSSNYILMCCLQVLVAQLSNIVKWLKQWNNK